jgi:hypothetical protein
MRGAMPAQLERVRADRDRLAVFADDGWGHHAPSRGYLLRHLSKLCRVAPDVGCGSGALIRPRHCRSTELLG